MKSVSLHVTVPEIIFLTTGLAVAVIGILLFYGMTKWGRKSYQFSGVTLTAEAMGVILFLIGIIMMLAFLIPVLTPRFLSPGMS